MGRISDNERALIELVRDGQWEIDSQGRIWRTAHWVGLRNGGKHLVPCERRRVEKVLPQGYLQVRATIDGKRLHTGAHRLVWQHFNGDIPVGHEINHKNGLKDDNRPGNLTCGSAGDNIAHAHRAGLIDQHGQKNPAAKLSDSEVAKIRLAYTQGGYTQAQLAEKFGVAHQTVSKLVRGHRRGKQGGPTRDADHRHLSTERDPVTGRITSTKKAGMP